MRRMRKNSGDLRSVGATAQTAVTSETTDDGMKLRDVMIL